MRVACAIFFILFTFLYLYDYQADIMSVIQHVLSQGATHYNRLVGAVLITLVLWLLQFSIYGLIRLERVGHALSYFPSLLLLAILTDVTRDVDTEPYLGCWIWLFPLLMIAYAAVIWICRQMESLDGSPFVTESSSRLLWQNMSIMVAMMLMTCSIGCSDEVFHYRMKMENDLAAGRFDQALKTGINEEKTDSSLTFLRIWALASTHQLGDRLFEYPLVGGSDAMLPNGTSVKVMMASTEPVYKMLGVYFKQRMRPRVYFTKLHQKWWATKNSNDWLLCAYLLDCDIDAFAHNISKYYSLDSRLPKHYREALILYTHLREHPYLVYHDAVMDADYEDYQDMSRKYPNPVEQFSQLKDTYGKTYWFYFFTHRHAHPRQQALG